MNIFKVQKYSEINITNTNVFICKSFVIFSLGSFTYKRGKSY